MFHSKKGFTMIELLVVLLIIGILAAVAAPMYLIHTEKAKASEAVGVMSLIRQAEREYFTVHNAYLEVGSGKIENDPADPSALNRGLGVIIGPSQYFGKADYSVSLTLTSTLGITDPKDFVIKCSSTGATTDTNIRNPGDVTGWSLEMDNSGQIMFKPGATATAKSYK